MDVEICDDSVGTLFAEVECIRPGCSREGLVSLCGNKDIVVGTSDQSVAPVRSNYELWRSWVFRANASEHTCVPIIVSECILLDVVGVGIPGDDIGKCGLFDHC